MAFPLLLPLMVAGAAGGQEWYNKQRARASGENMQGLLGTAPAEQAGPVQPGEGPLMSGGSGLMANPGDVQQQMQVMSGILGMNPRDRLAAATMFLDITGRATQQDNMRQANQWATTRHAADTARQESQFGQQMEQANKEFEANSARYGKEQAFREWQMKKGGIEEASKAAELRAAQERQAAIDKMFGPDVQMGPAGTIPAGYQRKPVEIAPGQYQWRTVPQVGSTDWQKAQQEVDKVDMLNSTVDELVKSLQTYGTEHLGSEAGRQGSMYNRLAGLIANVDQLGTLQPGDLARIANELPNPSDKWRLPISTSKLIASLNQLKAQGEKQGQLYGEKYRGFGLRPAGTGYPGQVRGESAPPPGSVPYGN